MKLLSFHSYITKEQRQMLKRLKIKTQVAVSDHVRNALDLYLNSDYKPHPTSDDTPLVSFHCNITEEQKQKLDELKEKTQVKIATHFRNALNRYFETKEDKKESK